MKIQVYHGTNCKFNQFNNDTTDDTNIAGEIYFTNDMNLARQYARERTNDLGGIETVIKAEITINNAMPQLLTDSINMIMEYAKRNDGIEAYKTMYNDFNSNGTMEFAKYVSAKMCDEVGNDIVSGILQDWGFDGIVNEDIYATFNTNSINIISVKSYKVKRNLEMWCNR